MPFIPALFLAISLGVCGGFFIKAHREQAEFMGRSRAVRDFNTSMIGLAGIVTSIVLWSIFG
jgi:hypothetical protein